MNKKVSLLIIISIIFSFGYCYNKNTSRKKADALANKKRLAILRERIFDDSSKIQQLKRSDDIMKIKNELFYIPLRVTSITGYHDSICSKLLPIEGDIFLSFSWANWKNWDTAYFWARERNKNYLLLYPLCIEISTDNSKRELSVLEVSMKKHILSREEIIYFMKVTLLEKYFYEIESKPTKNKMTILELNPTEKSDLEQILFSEKLVDSFNISEAFKIELSKYVKEMKSVSTVKTK